MPLPFLTQARAPLTCEVDAVNEYGERHPISIPAERALTVYVDKRELVTLMTLGAQPELLVLGFLRNQRLVQSVQEVESITVDWDVGAAAVKTRQGISDIEARTSKRVVTTGCGQGSVFGDLMAEVDSLVLPDATLSQSQLYGIVNAIRLQETTYKSAGSVHGCALFRGEEMLVFVEDVGRHNAIDTIAGWMWLQSDGAPTLATACAALPPEGAVPCLGRPGAAAAPTTTGHLSLVGMGGADKVFYTTGRLTSEMVIKSAQMGVPIVVSRSGITQMGHAVAQRLGLCTIGRATNKRFLCYSATERLRLQPELAGVRLHAAA
jgi:FdhD protein